mmetsp:Transcript_27703/g.51554  ORF Transcript_27703/g.51554 Transcript_27703/m.51554 type:complete len:176 (-) Transcript_27703:199-726(-)
MPPHEFLRDFECPSGILEYEEDSPRIHSSDDVFCSDAHIVEEEKAASRRSTVRFSVVEIREFDRVIGDHPDTREGLSLSIGWDYSERDAVSLDEYEGDREYQPRRSKNDLKLTPRMKRKVMKRGFGVSKDEIEKAERKVEQKQRRRERRMKMHPFVVRTEDALRLATRKVKRLSV